MALTHTAEKPKRTIGQSFLWALVLVGGMGLTGADEILVSTPFIALNEALGFWTGWVASTIFWALLGLATLITVDVIWPIIKPFWNRVYQSLVRAGNQLFTLLTSNVNILNSTLAIAAVGGIMILTLFYGERVVRYLGDHIVFVGLIGGVVAVIFGLLVAYEWLRSRIEWLVDFVPTITKQRIRTMLKLVAGLAVLVYMGPVLSRPFLIPLGVTKKGWAYILTFVAAPCFAGFWYPFYTLGVWDTIQRILF